jgi:hypothetical protein
MEELKAHPNTQAVLDAWRRLSEGVDSPEGPTTDDYPGLVGRLFVLNHVAERDYSFRRVGYAIEQLFGRQLIEHNFLSIWSESDRRLVNAALTAAIVDRGPTLVRARGETLVGKRVDLDSPRPVRCPERALLGLPTMTPEKFWPAGHFAGCKHCDHPPAPTSSRRGSSAQMNSRPPPYCLSRQHPSWRDAVWRSATAGHPSRRPRPARQRVERLQAGL